MVKFEGVIPVKVKGMVECSLFENGSLREKFTVPNTFTTWGLEQIARVVCAAISGDHPINQVRVRINGAWNTFSVTNSRSGNTLVVQSETISTPGTYDALRCANSGDTVNYHDQIGFNLVLPSGSEVAFTTYISFTGLGGIVNGVNQYGNTICASELGQVGDGYDLDGIDRIKVVDTSDNTINVYVSTLSTATNGTLTLRGQTPVTVPATYNKFFCTQEPSGFPDQWQAFFVAPAGNTVVLGSNQELEVIMQIVFQ